MSEFIKGKSGNPKGRPIGIADKRTVLNSLLKPHAEALINKAVEMALSGDTCALRLCLERLVPKINSEAVAAPLPMDDVKSLESLLNSNADVIKAAALGELTLEQAQSFTALLESQHKLIVDTEIVKRMAAIEETLKLKKREQK